MNLAVVRESQEATRADDHMARAAFTAALTAGLAELDALLAVALERTECEFTPQGALDGLRGLHISRDDVRRALDGPRVGLAADGDAVERIALKLSSASRFEWLIRAYDLDAFEIVAFLIALAPEIDLRYQRVYAYLQDDVTKKRPTVDLLLNLLCATSLERLERRATFGTDGALVRHELVDLVADPNYVQPPLLARYVKPREHIVRFLTEPDAEAARFAASRDALGRLTQRIEPRACWNDLVLPTDALDQLRELCDRMLHRQRVMEEWGFARTLSRGRGTAALFAGGSGTGKTLSAEVIANALGMELYRVDLARVVDKYIGETEKNLAQVFDAAARAGAILFFDEADALFGKRSEVKDAHDRYANIEVSYLLQRMEDYDGLAILATNLREHLDAAFARRLAFSIHFPWPDEEHRFALWSRAWPHTVPMAANVDARALARRYKLSGGNIRNIALAATFLAAAGDGVVSMAHVQRAVEREYQKLGKEMPRGPVTDSARVSREAV